MKRPVQDVELVARARGGDSAAFDGLVRRYHDALWRTCRRVLHDESAAEDCAQETWLRIRDHLGDYDPTYAFGTWALTIAARLAMNRTRDRAREERAVKTLALERREEWRPADGLERRERVEALAGALAALDPEDRLLLAYRVEESRPYAEIAEILGTNEGALRVRFFRILSTLRVRLKEE